MIPLRDVNPTRRTPVVTRALIFANALVFIWELSLGPQLPRVVGRLALVPGRLTGALSGAAPLVPAAQTLVTSMFLHGGWIHLIGNMWYLWIFGDNIEDRLGPARYAAFYLAAGLVAGVVHTLVNPHSPVPTVGASGAIAGVLGAYAIAFPGARVVTLVPFFFFAQLVTLPALVVLGMWFVIQFFSGTLSLGSGAGGGIAWWAHIAGFAFGAVAMAVMAPRRDNRSQAWVEE